MPSPDKRIRTLATGFGRSDSCCSGADPQAPRPRRAADAAVAQSGAVLAPLRTIGRRWSFLARIAPGRILEVVGGSGVTRPGRTRRFSALTQIRGIAGAGRA